MNQKTFYQRFPELAKLTDKLHEKPPGSDAPWLQKLAKILMDTFNQSDINIAIETFKAGIQSWLAQSQDPEEDWEDLICFYAAYKLSIPDLCVLFSEIAVHQGEGIKLARVYQHIAYTTQNPLFHFMAAWIFLNLNQLDACIQQCKAVSLPYSPIQSLLGQALLENVQIEEACLALRKAIQMSPQDLLSWFLFAKANFSINQLDEAWEALLVCERLSPANIEVQTMMGLIAIDQHCRNDDWVRKAWDELLTSWKNDHGNGLLTVLMYQIAFRLEDRIKVDFLTTSADWPRLSHNQDFMQNLSGILRAFQFRIWHLEKLNFLDQISALMESPCS